MGTFHHSEQGRQLALEALEVTAGNIRSLGPAGVFSKVYEPYTVWLRVVETAIERLKA